jgi:uncharacterized protein
MELNVLRELRQPIGSVTIIDLDERDLTVDHLDIDRLTGQARLLRTDRGLLVKVESEGRAQSRCSRCLTDVEIQIHVRFEEEYVPRIDPNTGAPVRLLASDAADVFRIGADFMLDLHEAMRQYILMSEPAKPLCRADCAGLCPDCGAELNLGPCGCPPEGDARWAPLAALRTRYEGS